MHDLKSIDDIVAVVDAFYADIEHDPVLGSYFVGLDMNGHLQKMYAFWSSVVFQSGAYLGRPFDVHAGLPELEARHFVQWLMRFQAVVDARYAGRNASRMKSRAAQIAWVFNSRLCSEPLPESPLNEGPATSPPPAAEASR